MAVGFNQLLFIGSQVLKPHFASESPGDLGKSPRTQALSQNLLEIEAVDQ